ncbi:heme-binding protein [Reinekea sp. G2M2-21]|uniref:GlcG/HbpS family heme-binding protein n=1 Tax=Reinekea sp. G2M2-21 TaxID=2788942 RepID=UPI001E5DD1FA|nr:heme-binding protein [Reinekea sp. G2M2-21]
MINRSTGKLSKTLARLFFISLMCLSSSLVFAEGSVGIDLVQAERALKFAEKEASKMNTKMNIAVVDAGANLVAFIRMDGAFIGSIDIAIKKAKTARLFDMPTDELGALSQPGGDLYNIELSNEGLITFAGGLPIHNSAGEVIGAIGVSGDTVENDKIVAQAGVDAVK